MDTRELGQTGVRIFELAFGTWEYKGTVEALRGDTLVVVLRDLTDTTKPTERAELNAERAKHK